MNAKLCQCGSMSPAEHDRVQRHKALCGTICIVGAALGEGYQHGEKYHELPWNGPPETDGHYHGECPAGCFKDCCNPPGNLCGKECLKCFGCKSCGYIHASTEPCIESRYR